MAIQQAGSCVVERGNGALVADLGLHQDQFILDKLSLRFQREEDGLTPQLIFALFCFEILLRKIARHSSSGLREFGLFQLMNGLAYLQANALLNLAKKIKAAPLGHEGVPQICLDATILYRQVQLYAEPVGRKSKLPI